MAKVVNSFAELETAIARDLTSAMTGARNEIEEKLEDNVMDYYSQGSPKIYKRTGTLLTSPETTPVSGGGKEWEFTAYMDESISYSTGTYSGAEVIDVTEKGVSGVLGKSGYFRRTEDEVPDIVDKHMSKYFDRA